MRDRVCSRNAGTGREQLLHIRHGLRHGDRRGSGYRHTIRTRGTNQMAERDCNGRRQERVHKKDIAKRGGKAAPEYGFPQEPLGEKLRRQQG